MTTGNSDSGLAAGLDHVKRLTRRVALRNWRVRWRLTALVLVPTLAGVALGGARVVGSVQSIGDYDRTAVAAEQAGRIRDLVQALGMERDTGGWSNAARSLRKQLAEPYAERKTEVDRLIKAVRADLATMDESYGDRVMRVVQRTHTDLNFLPRVRAEGQRDTTRYDSLLDTLLRLHEELSLITDDSQIVGQFRALNALTRAKEQVSRQRAQLLRGHYNSASVDAKEIERFIASNAAQRSEIATVAQEAGAEVGMKLQKALTIPEYYNTELTKSRAITLASGKAPGVRIRTNLLAQTTRDKSAPDQWFDENTTVIEALSGIENGLNQEVALRSQELRDTETRNAIVAAALILGLLLLVLLLTVAIARSMVSPLRRLRTEALEIAGFRLPDVVRKMRVSGDAAVPEVRPISVEGNDEIGEVAKAFDQVHRQAIRLAGEEAELRGNISAMFVNLSRRTQTLVERQISLIDGLEKGEQDGGRLSDLFKLDHLATRMRRNSENLLVLAGHEPTRRRSQPAKLVDVVRAALSEVEGYERVQVKVHRATSVLGSAANDLVHLVAELVENAIQFSPKDSQVVVSSSLIEGGGALLSVTDSGISMTTEELGEANRRLAEPPVVDVSVSRRMGLFVVGRLALRHGIRVQLRKGDGNGLIAMVLLPAALVQDANQPPLPQRQAGLGGAAAPAPQRPPAAPAPQSGYRSYSTFDAPEAAGAGRGRPFTADTDGGAFGPRSYDSGTGHNGASLPQSYDSGTGSGPFRPQSYDSGAHPSYPGTPPPQGPPSFGTPPSQDLPPGPPKLPTRGGPPRDAAPPAYPSADPFTSDPFPSDPFPSDPFPSGPARSPGPERIGSFPSYPSADSSYPTPQPRYDTNDVRKPVQPPPSVEVSAMEAEPEEYLPIFASVESAWFRKPPDETAPEPNRNEQSTANPVPSVEETWRTAADAGWRAAAAASDPSLGGVTAAGLPKRTPKANLVPGTVGQPEQPQRQAPVPPVSATRVRSRMASFQQGVRRGRAEVREQEERSE